MANQYFRLSWQILIDRNKPKISSKWSSLKSISKSKYIFVEKLPTHVWTEPFKKLWPVKDPRAVTNSPGRLAALNDLKMMQFAINCQCQFLWLTISLFTKRWSASTIAITFVKKLDNHGLFFVYFRSFQTNITNFYNKYMWKNVHPVYSAGIWTHNLRNMSLFP